MQKIRKIDNSWKSFNTRTIGSSPANRSTFLHTTWLRFHLSPETPFGFIRCAVKPRPSGRGGCQLDALELVDTSGAPD
ncbi:hypothetical protein ABEM57_20895, partial [Escherichia coli]